MPTVSQLLQDALAHHRSGKLAQAETLYRQIVRVHPRHADALHLLGVAAHQQKRHAAAVDYIGRAIGINESAAMYHGNLAAAYWELGEAEQAIACYRRATQLSPQWAEAWINLATVYFAGERFDEARECYERGLKIDPNSALAWNNLGSIHRSESRLTESNDCFRRALQVDPDYAPAHNNLGNALRDAWSLEEAAVCYRRALQLRPGFAQAHNNLGNVLIDQMRVAEAAGCYRQAIAVDPNLAEAHRNLGSVFAGDGKLVEAAACYSRAIELSPHDDGLKIQSALLMPAIPTSTAEIARIRNELQERIDRLSAQSLKIDDPVQNGCRPLFYTAYHGMDDRHLLESLAALYLRATSSLGDVAPHCRDSTAAGNPAKRRIRVGFISRFFYEHSIGDHYASLIANIPRDDIHVTVFRFPSPDDEVTRLLSSSVDALVTLCPNLSLARRQIADEQLDVLYYTDIGQDPWTYFLAFSRLAPVQCVSLGQPVTTGIPTVDYFVSDAYLEPDDAEDHYSEQLVRLTNPPNCFRAPRLPAFTWARADFGLDDRSHLYVCAQMLFKMHPEFDSLLAGILRADPRGQVVLFEGEQPHWTELLRNRLEESIPDVAGRICFLPRQSFENFLHMLSLADVLLDTIHFSGGTTTCQAFALGIPIVTLPGRYARGRGTYCWYRRMGVTDCIAGSPEDYVRKAVQLATNRQWRQQISDRIRASQHVLIGNSAASSELAEFFIEAARRGVESPNNAARETSDSSTRQ